MSATSHQLGRIVVVGGGLGGTRTCEQLRRAGFEGELVLISAETERPYDRPPLSKEVLRGDRDDTTLNTDFDAIGVQLVLGTTAVGLDLGRSVVKTAGTGVASGEMPFDGLVIATGARAITLPGPGEQFTVRTAQDARRLRERLVPGARVVIVGASWIGAEVATSALARGCTVTCVEAASAPAARALGAEVGKRLVPWWSEVDLRLDTPVDHIADGAVVLADGAELPADVVVVGVGGRPDVEWLDGSGLELDRGVVVDEWLRAAPNVVALGDAAAWWSRRYAMRMRVEHWDDAVSGAPVAAASLLEGAGQGVDVKLTAEVHDPIPYFWSDQFGHKLQYVGHHDPDATPIWRETADGPGWGAAWLDDQGRLAAYLAVDRPRDLLGARRVLAAGGRPDPARLADPEIAVADA